MEETTKINLADANKELVDYLEDSYTPDHQVGKVGEVTEKDKLSFAIYSLAAVAAMFSLSATAYIFIPSEASLTVFEDCKTILPPITLMILGAYFSRKD